MERLICILAFVAVSCTDLSSDKSAATPSVSQLPEGAVIQPYEGMDGLQRVIVYDGNHIIGEGDFLEDLHHGSWVVYDISGKITSITSYLNGQKQGPELLFDKIGYVEVKANYAKDQLSGEYLKYKRRSVIERKHYVNGVMQGTQYRYYQDGKTLMEAANYTNGMIDGIAKYYNQQGELSFQYTYDMGKLVSE